MQKLHLLNDGRFARFARSQQQKLHNLQISKKAFHKNLFNKSTCHFYFEKSRLSCLLISLDRMVWSSMARPPPPPPPSGPRLWAQPMTALTPARNSAKVVGPAKQLWWESYFPGDLKEQNFRNYPLLLIDVGETVAY